MECCVQGVNPRQACYMGRGARVPPVSFTQYSARSRGDIMAFNLDTWISDYKLSAATVKILKEESLDEEEVLSHLTDNDIANSELGNLPLGDKIRLRKAVSALNDKTMPMKLYIHIIRT